MNNAIPLFEWSTTGEPPDLRLQGRIEDGVHPFLQHGGRITSSRIVEVTGRIVRTNSGTLYKLETVDPKFLTWLNDHGYVYNEAEPIGLGKDSRKAK